MQYSSALFSLTVQKRPSLNRLWGETHFLNPFPAISSAENSWAVFGAPAPTPAIGPLNTPGSHFSVGSKTEMLRRLLCLPRHCALADCAPPLSRYCCSLSARGRMTNVAVLRRQDAVLVKFVSERASPFSLRLHLELVGFITPLIPEHTLVLLMRSSPAHKSHTVSHARTQAHTRALTCTHTLCSPLLWPRHFKEPSAVCECS